MSTKSKSKVAGWILSVLLVAFLIGVIAVGKFTNGKANVRCLNRWDSPLT